MPQSQSPWSCDWSCDCHVISCSGAKVERSSNVAAWNFEDDDSVTMVRPSKSREPAPAENHTPNHLGTELENGDLPQENAEWGDEGVGELPTPVETKPPQLSIEDTVFVETKSPAQRNSLVSRSHDRQTEDEEGKRRSVVSIEGSSGIVVVSVQSL